MDLVNQNRARRKAEKLVYDQVVRMAVSREVGGGAWRDCVQIQALHPCIDYIGGEVVELEDNSKLDSQTQWNCKVVTQNDLVGRVSIFRDGPNGTAGVFDVYTVWPAPVWVDGGVPSVGDEVGVKAGEKHMFVGQQGFTVESVQGGGIFNVFPTRGDPGPIGIQGPQGIFGPQGLPGNTGAGVQGPQGPLGVQGSVGPQGDEGLEGIEGPQGFQGPQDAQGRQGWQGIQGIQGAQGNQGSQGNQGWQGFQDAVGRQGAQGASGSAGSITSSAANLSSDYDTTGGATVMTISSASLPSGSYNFFFLVGTLNGSGYYRASLATPGMPPTEWNPTYMNVAHADYEESCMGHSPVVSLNGSTDVLLQLTPLGGQNFTVKAGGHTFVSWVKVS